MNLAYTPCAHARIETAILISIFFADRVAVIILGIITLIAGVLLSSIPWLDYFLLKVSVRIGRGPQSKTRSSITHKILAHL